MWGGVRLEAMTIAGEGGQDKQISSPARPIQVPVFLRLYISFYDTFVRLANGADSRAMSGLEHPVTRFVGPSALMVVGKLEK
jgi:hypothetical protein